MALKKKVKKVEEVQAETVEKEVVETETVEEEVVETVEEEVVETEKSAPAQNTGMSTTGQKSDVVVSKSEIANSAASFSQRAAEQGFEDVQVGGFGSFPTIVLGTDGKFECDEEDWGSEGFIGQLQTTKALYMYIQEGVTDGPVGYSYDRVNLTNEVEGITTVAELKASWEDEGHTMTIKVYKEVLVEIVQEDHEYEGSFFIVKISPTGVAPFDGQLFIADRKGIALSELKIHFGVGKKRKAANGNNYYPWKFKIAN